MIVARQIGYLTRRTIGCYVVFFFFSSRRRHTRFDCDWSSDVCSSDLTATTNCAGNFWIRPNDFVLAYPVRVTVAAEYTSIDMESRIFREGSCAVCHGDPRSPSSAGHVFLLDDPGAQRPGATHFCK